MSFASEISRDLPPSGGVPFHYPALVGVSVEPLHCSAQESEKRAVDIVLRKSSLYFAVAYPGHARYRIGIDGVAHSEFILQGEGVDYCQKFPEIIGAPLKRPDAEKLTAGHKFDPAVFVRPRVFKACGVYSPCGQIDLRIIEIIGVRGVMPAVLACSVEKACQVVAVLLLQTCAESLRGFGRGVVALG